MASEDQIEPGGTNRDVPGVLSERGTLVSAKEGFRTRLPDLLIQAVFVFLAVFLALAAEEWRDARSRQALADRALNGVLLELSANRKQLEKDQTRIEDLERVFGQRESDGEQGALQINYQFALMSSAAWEAAQMSQAVHIMEIEKTTELAAVYNLQAFFGDAQKELMDDLTTFSVRRQEDPDKADQELKARLRTTINYRMILSQVYDNLMAQYQQPSAL